MRIASPLIPTIPPANTEKQARPAVAPVADNPAEGHSKNPVPRQTLSSTDLVLASQTVERIDLRTYRDTPLTHSGRQALSAYQATANIQDDVSSSVFISETV